MSKDQETGMIPPEIKEEAFLAAVAKAQILAPGYVEKIVRSALNVIEAHLVQDEHITRALKEVGGYPVEWQSRACYTFEHPKN